MLKVGINRIEKKSNHSEKLLTIQRVENFAFVGQFCFHFEYFAFFSVNQQCFDAILENRIRIILTNLRIFETRTRNVRVLLAFALAWESREINTNENKLSEGIIRFI